MSPLLAQSRHGLLHCKCPLLGAKRTSRLTSFISASDLEETSCHGAKARICLGLSIVVNRRSGRHAATRWKRTAIEGPAPEDEAQRSQSADRTCINCR